MKFLFLLSIAAAALLAGGCAAGRFYVGGDDGIHLLARRGFFPDWHLDRLAPETGISSLCVGNRTLYAARRAAKGAFKVGVWRILEDGRLEKSGSFTIPGSRGYCHISLSNDGKFLFGSSYSGSFVDILGLTPEGGIAGLRRRYMLSGAGIHKRQKSSHPHCTAQVPGGRTVLTADLGSDLIRAFTCSEEAGLTPGKACSLPPGTGPRHLCFGAGGMFFSVNELNNSVYSFRIDGEKAVLLGRCDLLPPEWAGRSYAGAIKVRNGKLYVTNRGHDTVSVIAADGSGALSCEARFPAFGKFPSDLAFTRSGIALVNMKSDQVVIVEKKGGDYVFEKSLTLRRPACIVPVPEL